MSEPVGMETVRPRDFAILLLASGDLRPRQRARDQEADRMGLALKRILLDHVVVSDPEPATLAAALLQFIREHSLPDGPGRALAQSILEEWEMAQANPLWVSQLLNEATRASRKG